MQERKEDSVCCARVQYDYLAGPHVAVLRVQLWCSVWQWLSLGLGFINMSFSSRILCILYYCPTLSLLVAENVLMQSVLLLFNSYFPCSAFDCFTKSHSTVPVVSVIAT